MTRMGLRNLVCVISSGSTTEASSERSGSEQAEGEEYSPMSSEGAAAAAAHVPSLSKCGNNNSREPWHGPPGGYDHGRAAAAAHEPVSPASGSTHMFSCFHACTINLIAHHPVMGSSVIGSQRKGGSPATGDHHHHHHHQHHNNNSTATPSGLGPRSRSFMNGAGEHVTSGDDPISPVVTCIGQVRVKQTKAAKTATESVEAENKQGPKKGLLQRSTLNRMPDSPRLSRWRHFLGGKATAVNPSSQRGPEHDFEIDLNRFSTTCSSLVKTAPSLEDITTQARSGSFLAKSLMLLQLDCDESTTTTTTSSTTTTTATTQSSNQIKPALEAFHKAKLEVNAIKLNLPKVGIIPTKPTPDQEPLWKRRCGAKPLMLDLQKRSQSAPPSLN